MIDNSIRLPRAVAEYLFICGLNSELGNAMMTGYRLGLKDFPSDKMVIDYIEVRLKSSEDAQQGKLPNSADA